MKGDSLLRDKNNAYNFYPKYGDFLLFLLTNPKEVPMQADLDNIKLNDDAHALAKKYF